MLLKILKSHPQVRYYYTPAHPERESLETYFQTKLLLNGSPHLWISLASAYPRGKWVSATYEEWVVEEACSGGILQLERQWSQGCSDCEMQWPCHRHYTYLLLPRQDRDKQPGACIGMSHAIIQLGAMCEEILIPLHSTKSKQQPSLPLLYCLFFCTHQEKKDVLII